MSHQTNATVTLVRETQDWQGNISRASVGSYSVWNEERKTVLYHQYRRDIRGFLDEAEASKGMFFLFSDVDLTDTVAVFDGSSYPVMSWDRFTDRKNDFHHLEVFYK